MKAYGYCRYSSDLQNEASIEQQKNELNEYANKHNITIIDFYCDEAKSGTKDNRENFQCMISDCKKKLVDCILVWKTDRFARNTQDALFYKMQLEKLGIQLISITQPIDSATPEGALMYTLLAGMDEYYSRTIASNVKRAFKNDAKKGLSNGGTAPLGYDLINRRYVVNEQEKIIVQKIFEMYINGLGITEIAFKLNELGYKTKKGKLFKKNSIYDLIGNEKYTGTYIYNKADGYNRHKYNDDVIRIENSFEPIISKETFDKAMQRRQANKKNNSSFKSKRVYLLSGLIYCGECGGKYCGSTSVKVKNGTKFENSYYSCNNRNKVGKCTNHIINKEKIENYVFNILVNKLLNGNSIESLTNKIKIEYNKLKNNSSDLIKQTQIQLNSIEIKLNNLLSMIEISQTPSLLKRIEELDQEKVLLQNQIQNLKLSKSEISDKQIIDALRKDYNSLIDKNKDENIKPIIQKYIKRITIYSDRFEIDFTFSKDSYIFADMSGFGSPRPDVSANFKFTDKICVISTQKIKRG